MTCSVKWRLAIGPMAKMVKAIIMCPGCGNDVAIGRAHTIEADGLLSPSMVCPICPFHEYVRLAEMVAL